MEFFKKAYKKIRLFVLYWVRIVFVKNKFKVGFFTKLKANLCGGFLADQYALYDFKHNDRKEYLSELDWHRSRYINEPFQIAFDNKVICAEILKHHIRMAENLFIKNKGIVYDFETGLKSNDDVLKCLKSRGALIIKPFDLGKGNGVHRIGWQNDRIYIDGEEKSTEDFLDFLDSKNQFIICEYIKQHPYADRLYDKTSNTIRLITMRDPKTHVHKVFFAVQRMGTAKTIPVDNGSKGGLVSKIDVETGRLSEARCLHNRNVYYEHPDSKNRIEGMVVPGWDDVKDEILKVSQKLPFIDFIAWDLLITEKGVCVIEANSSSGVNIIQLWGGQRNGELGDFYRHYNVIK